MNSIDSSRDPDTKSAPPFTTQLPVIPNTQTRKIGHYAVPFATQIEFRWDNADAHTKDLCQRGNSKVIISTR